MRIVRLPWIHPQHALQFWCTNRKKTEKQLHFITRTTTGSPSNDYTDNSYSSDDNVDSFDLLYNFCAYEFDIAKKPLFEGSSVRLIDSLAIQFSMFTTHPHISMMFQICLGWRWLCSQNLITYQKHTFKRTLIIIINALVFSKLFYCSNVWSNTSKANLHKLQSVQNFACIIATDTKKFDHITPQLKKLRWLSVREQLYFRFATLTFKCMTGCAPDYLSSKFVKRSDISSRVTRNSQLLNIPLYRTASGQKSFHYRVVSLWNDLDSNLKLSKSIIDLKREIRKIMYVCNWIEFAVFVENMFL
jgi:hypothetical protein